MSKLIDSIKDSVARQNIRLELKCRQDVPPVFINVNGIEDALLNLIDNAIEACAGTDCGNIVVSTDFNQAANHVEITVTDDGPGVPEDIQGKIFEPFFTTKGVHGTGLGLAITQNTLHHHNGSLTFHSRPAQTTFTVRLPIELGKPMKKLRRTA